METFMEFYLEEKTLYDKSNYSDIISSVKLVDTQHSRFRQGRKEQYRKTTDSELMESISKIEQSLIDDWENGEIPSKGQVLVVNNDTHLNIIVAYSFITSKQDKSMSDGDTRLKLTIVTDMIKSNFKVHDVEKVYQI